MFFIRIYCFQLFFGKKVSAVIVTDEVKPGVVIPNYPAWRIFLNALALLLSDFDIEVSGGFHFHIVFYFYAVRAFAVLVLVFQAGVGGYDNARFRLPQLLRDEVLIFLSGL